jgi:hypothetical protein
MFLHILYDTGTAAAITCKALCIRIELFYDAPYNQVMI